MDHQASREAKRQQINAILEQMELFNRYFDHTEALVQSVFDRMLKERLPAPLHSACPTMTECHILQSLSAAGPSNGSQLAKKLSMTGGGVSKAMTKLIKKKLVSRETRPDNRKEVYYTLTTTGQAIAEAHAILHEKIRQQTAAAFAAYKTTDLALVADVLAKMVNRLNDFSIFPEE
ncbi:MAG: MarR family transcriptional regulator [Peptococcaceae bacterium]|jgi:DNA-binding MarR family transcriptional regulator|nr:MarR family transcriptional regulator [Peptococcaceae bacterium]